MDKAKQRLQMASKKSKAGKAKIVTTVDENYGRRKWDVLGGPKKSSGDQEDEMILVNERTKNLTSRAHDLHLERDVGRSFILGKDQEKAKKIFYCEVCETNFNDSMSYVDHLNGKRHNRILGMNMKVKRVTADSIRAKLLNPVKVIDKSLEQMKREEELKNAPEEQESEEGEAEEEEFENEEDDIDEEDREAMLAMGIPLSFGSTKRY